MRIVIGIMALLVASSAGRAQSFHKTRIIDPKGKEIKVDLAFDQTARLIRVTIPKKPPVEIPYGAIGKMSYELTSRHRVKEGAVVMIASLGAGGIVMLTKSKNHWLYFDYKQEGIAKDLTLKLDKTEFEKVLAAAKQQTGKDVEMIAQKKSDEGKKK